MARERAMERNPALYGARVEMRAEKILTERETLELVRRGNREAYGEIVKKYMKPAYYIVLSFVHNHQDALDLSQ